MVRDILWLRILAVVATACLIPYFYIQPEPLMTPIYWNLVFAALNIYWICRLLLERRPVKLSAEEQRLCELVFRTMTPREMRSEEHTSELQSLIRLSSPVFCLNKNIK